MEATPVENAFWEMEWTDGMLYPLLHRLGNKALDFRRRDARIRRVNYELGIRDVR